MKHKWFWGGIALGLLNALVFTHFWSDRPIGASTAYPFAASYLVKLNNEYVQKVTKPGLWEVWFLAGGILGTFVVSLIRRDFKLRLVYPFWKETKGGNVIKRIFYAFIGGFILILGARFAGGCTSGHVLSGGMQLAVSSFTFGLGVLTSAFIFASLFYGKGGNKGGEENG